MGSYWAGSDPTCKTVGTSGLERRVTELVVWNKEERGGGDGEGDKHSRDMAKKFNP